MALNIAVPLSGVGEFLDNYALTSLSIPPIEECCDTLKGILASPIGSESSGISSLDLEEIKKTEESPLTTSSDEETETDEADAIETTEQNEEIQVDACTLGNDDLVSTAVAEINQVEEEQSETEKQVDVNPRCDFKIIVNDRDILDLGGNINSGSVAFSYAQLPENDNIQFFLDNRSQYHRLGATGHIQEFSLEKCLCCEFKYPVNGFQTATPQQPVGNVRDTLSYNINQIIGANLTVKNEMQAFLMNERKAKFANYNNKMANYNNRNPRMNGGSANRHVFNGTNGQNYVNKVNNSNYYMNSYDQMAKWNIGFNNMPHNNNYNKNYANYYTKSM